MKSPRELKLEKLLTQFIFFKKFLPWRVYQYLIYFSIAVTGFSALSSQVIWQKYLAILTGSSARSLSLVLAVFLLGLALGYYIFGFLTARPKLSRSRLLRLYGLVEIGTGCYILLFPFYFNFLKKLSFNLPDLLIIDGLISLLALLLPTFLMGASLPLLTAAWPDHSHEIDKTHAKIYGLNGAGSALGALIAGFYLLPAWGLDLSLYFIGVLNILAGFVFVGNSLKGSVQKPEDPLSIPSSLPRSFFMIFVFFTGALMISFEIIFIRILNLSLGAGFANFPLILTLFISGLALGSLSLKKEKLSVSFLVRQLLFILFFLQILFWLAPYWSIWISHIRISLSSLWPNYYIYYALIFLFLLIFIFPAVFFMGRLAPLAYIFLKKSKGDYGKICGRLYFFNTLGTFFGAIVLGYLAFYLFDLDIIFKINIYAVFLLALALVFYRRDRWDFIVLSLLGLALLALPARWDRSGHELSYFRDKRYNPNIHFKGLFSLPKNYKENGSVSFFKDGPNTTVSLIQYFLEEPDPEILGPLQSVFLFEGEKFSSYSLIVNGKSDGDTLGDFSTVFFMLPYLYSSQKSSLETAFVGLGTGLSAGFYTPLEDVSRIEVLEISPFVIKAIQSVDPALNFQVMKQVSLIKEDAFKYFTKSDKKYDIIVSEPSNPWVVGVENLFTVEFYELINKSLKEGGIFGQWLHTYSMNLETLEIVIKSISQVFPQTALYKVGYKDILFIASQEELKLSQKKFNHPFVRSIYKTLGLREMEDLYLTRQLSPRQFSQVARLSVSPVNRLTRPLLIYKANKAFFLDQTANPFDFMTKHHPYLERETVKMRSFYKEKDWSKNCLNLFGFNFLCSDMLLFKEHFKNLNSKDKAWAERFNDYIFLRKRGLIPYSPKAMNGFFNEILKRDLNLDHLSNYISEKMKMRDYEGANKDALAFKNEGLINEQHYQNFRLDLEKVRQAHKHLDAQPAFK